ncbi:MAG: helix-turn-helix domain-containing protein [Candidatus Dadabacteria bacterium]|nr:helix-turn-helix domain-containing protein [Candidatus Dadabacteria bacterium]
MTTSKGRLLSPTKAAEELGLNRSVIYYWLRNKRFPFIKLQKMVLFWESDLIQFLDENTVSRDGGEN